MSPKNLFSLSILIACLGFVPPVSAENKIVWVYPCLFSQGGGDAPPIPLESYQCDFIRTRYQSDAGAVADFNDKGYDDQRTDLSTMLHYADRAKQKYDRSFNEILNKSDPAALPAASDPQERLKQLMELRENLLRAMFDEHHGICFPFLWESHKSSYWVPRPGVHVEGDSEGARYVPAATLKAALAGLGPDNALVRFVDSSGARIR